MKTVVRILALVTLALCSYAAQGQVDINIPPTPNQYTVLGRGFNWGGSGSGNLNNNFIFNPINADEGFCLFLSNNNPTSSHTVSVSVFQTGDPALTKFTGFAQKWFGVSTSTAFPVTVPALGIVGINYKTTASAGITVAFSGATTQAGSPDTIDFFAVQTIASSCGALASNAVQGTQQQGTTEVTTNQFPVIVGGLSSPGSASTVRAAHIGGNGSGWLEDGGACCQAFASGFQSNPAANFSNFQSATGPGSQLETVIDNFSMGFFGAKGTAPGYVKTNFLEIATDQFWQTQSATPAWVVLGKITNPAAGATLLSHFLTNASSINLADKNLTLSCSAVCEIIVARETTAGTTCTTLTPQNLQFGNNGTVLAPVAADTTQNACTTGPTLGTTMYDIQIAAGSTTTLDLSGFANFHSATAGSGLAVEVVGSITGVATASLTWVEQ